MIRCWSFSPEDRPTFIEVLRELEAIIPQSKSDLEDEKQKDASGAIYGNAAVLDYANFT